MIVECEECESKFNLNENLLKAGGSKVRCTKCKHVFTAYPPEEVQEEAADDDFFDEDMEETLALESRPVIEEEEEFGKAFEDAMEDSETVQTISPDHIPEEEDEEPADLEEAMERAAQIEEEVTAGEEGRQESEAPTMAIDRRKVTPGKKKKIKPPRSKVLPIILILILLIFGGGTALVFFAPEYLPDFLSFIKPIQKQEATDVGVRRLSFKGVNGAFAQSEKEGQLFVVKGVVTNNYPKGRSFILIKGTILDGKGKVIRRKMVYAGNPFTELELTEFSLEQIKNRSKTRLGMKRMNFNIKPGKSIPFMIVFEKLPEDLSEFTVEAVSSSPGT
ncbi:MAG: zinc-ribbon domain-containing protein [Deltaproteobacteria bacterium]|nr:zinc-ribbon domain-containing protein [Deltaproteobacteria bacterium]